MAQNNQTRRHKPLDKTDMALLVAFVGVILFCVARVLC